MYVKVCEFCHNSYFGLQSYIKNLKFHGIVIKKSASKETDYNGDKKTYVQSVYIPVSKEEMEGGSSYSSANNTQLMVLMETSTCMLVMANSEADEYLQPDLIFEDMERLYPDCPLAEGYKLKIAGTAFEEQLHLEEGAAEPIDGVEFIFGILHVCRGIGREPVEVVGQCGVHVGTVSGWEEQCRTHYSGIVIKCVGKFRVVVRKTGVGTYLQPVIYFA